MKTFKRLQRESGAQFDGQTEAEEVHPPDWAIELSTRLNDHQLGSYRWAIGWYWLSLAGIFEGPVATREETEHCWLEEGDRLEAARRPNPQPVHIPIASGRASHGGHCLVPWGSAS